MPRPSFAVMLVSCAIIATSFSPLTLHAQTVWSGFDFSFTKPSNFPHTQPENQDRITENVWITRDVQQGVFNIAVEDFYTAPSPIGTVWATDINNPGETIAATNWADLTFSPWIIAYGGPATQSLPTTLTSRNAVLYLIEDDIYLDIRFTQWTASALGGGFAYDRALPPAAPGPTGDYNLNTLVDAADYTLWRDTLGNSVSPGTGADGDESGIIDLPDYEFWKQHFGDNAPLVGASATGAKFSGAKLSGATGSDSAVTHVPEPSSNYVILVGLIALGAARRDLRRMHNRPLPVSLPPLSNSQELVR